MDNLKSISDYEVNIYYIDSSGGKHCTRSDKYSSFKDANEQFKNGLDSVEMTAELK